MFKLKAKFIGVNSIGFINGRVYDLSLVYMPRISKGLIQISTNNKPRLRCEYNSWELFIPNWQIISYKNMTGDHDVEVHHDKVNSGLKQAVRDNKINLILK
jgi:hypothetical protein